MAREAPIAPAAAMAAELDLLRAGSDASAAAAAAPVLEDVLQRAHASRLTALCLSGGGIRSAAFAVGLLEGLARARRLTSFDYLSTVSGGGYAGGWLSAWRHHARASAEQVPPPEPWPGTPEAAGEPAEPGPLRRLRRYVRYLAPHEGGLSIDLWTMFATMGRNLLLIWLVVLPIVGAALLLPYVYFAGIRVLDRPLVADATLSLADPGTLLLLASGLLVAISAGYVVADLPGLGGRGGSQRRFLLWCLAPLSFGGLGLTFFWAIDLVPVHPAPTILGAAVLHLLLWSVAGLATGHGWRPRTWAAAFLSGAVGGAGLWLLTTGRFGPGQALGYGYVTFAFPAVLGLALLVATLQVGLSQEETRNEDLEWWARFGGWLLVVMLAWVVACGLVLWGPLALDWVAREVLGLARLPANRVLQVVAGLAAVAGGVVARKAPGTPSGEANRPRTGALAAAAGVPIFAGLVLILLSLLNLRVLRGLSSTALAVDHTLVDLMAEVHLAEAVALAALLGAFGLLMALLLPVNKFSLHGMYRNRLVRTFVGAARPSASRRASRFTDFDPGDDVAMAELATLGGPLHVVNATLNTVADTQLSRLQRKAEPFTISPLHAGSWRLGYRPAAGYAREDRSWAGITLGTAMTLSGAAASPNMGARSTPALTFLMTLLNARLGAWLGNPGTAGVRTWRDANPRFGPWLLLRELAGSTDEHSPYVFLSDGGHFENLGVYEMVRRRCHLIVISDASCDPTYAYEDLSNAIRLVRIDFSIPIVFPDGLPGPATEDRPARHFSVGRIEYSAVDGPRAPDGVVVYAKATLTGDEPGDVLNYARSNPEFPHEPTSKQFFTEAQFESYRVLGRHTAEGLFAGDGTPVEAAEVAVAAGGGA